MKIDYIRLLIRKEMNVVGVVARGADKLVTARYATDGITARGGSRTPGPTISL